MKTTIDKFEKRLQNNLLSHSVIHNNKYCNWFEQAEFIPHTHLKHFIQQFSVFSNEFIVAQLRKVFNAKTREEMRDSKIILMNELGVPFEGDTVQNSRFKFEAAHFEWLLRIAEPLGLEFHELGRRNVASKSTLHFCDALIELYGNDNDIVGAGASYAIENWASAGFWKQLITGLTKYERLSTEKLDLGFFIWHDVVEDSHAHCTQIEMRKVFKRSDFDEDVFVNAGLQILDACLEFWDGLYSNAMKYHCIDLSE